MNMEDEDEYVDFYDFSKTYKNHPLMIEPADNAIKEAGEEEEDNKSEGSGGWEDCDLDDDDVEDGDEQENSDSF